MLISAEIFGVLLKYRIFFGVWLISDPSALRRLIRTLAFALAYMSEYIK